MKSLILIISLAIISSLIVPSFAAEVTLDTNKESYGPGDIVELSGIIENGVEGDYTAIEVKSPSGEIILVRTVTLGPGGSYYLKFKIPESGDAGSYDISVNAQIGGETVTESKTITHSSTPTPTTQTAPSSDSGGGCLIATATYGSELAPQVQMLRELRDKTVLSTATGTSFMTGFNALYYSFSPTIADWERQNPIFQEAVRVTITPLISTLSILNYVDIDSDTEMLGYGVGIIMLNVGMYFVAPAVII